MSADGRPDVLELARLVDEACEPTLSVRIGALVRLGAYVRMHADVIIAAIEYAQREAAREGGKNVSID